MATFVLVHGAWFGGWCWRETAHELRKNGHEVYTPSLTGMGDRRHLMNDKVDLDLHIMDITKVIIEEELDNVILCGHSYAGYVIAGVAEHIPNRIKKLIFVDAFVPKEGKTLMEIVPEKVKHLFLDSSIDSHPGFIPPKEFAIDLDEHKNLLTRRCSPQPLRTFKQEMNGKNWLNIPRKYILAKRYPVHHEMFEQKVINNKDNTWEYDIIDSGHIIMLDKPLELAKSLATNID